MRVVQTDIEGVLVLKPNKARDERGFFSVTFNVAEMREAGVVDEFLQDNHAFTRARGTVRGLHFQRPPFAQAKLVRVVRGAIYDVAVDLRKGSPTYGQHIGLELSADSWTQLYVPAGFAHGYCTLSDDVEVIYKVSAAYQSAAEGGFRWDDPDLVVEWPIEAREISCNDRDRAWPDFRDFVTPF